MLIQLLQRVSQIGTVLIGLGVPALAYAAPPITTGLFVNVNADSASNFTLGGANEVQLWKDLANDGSDGTFQDFGNNAAANQPLFATTSMPNGQVMNVVDFSRGGTVTGAASSRTNSDFLGSAAGGIRGTFAFGGDSAYTLGGTANPDGLSYFVVWHTDLTTNPTPTSSSSSNVARQARQTVLISLTSDGAVVDQFGVVMNEDTTTSVIGSNTVPNYFHFARDSKDSPPPDDATQRFTPVVDITSNWYISALTANLDGGNVLARTLQSDGTDTGTLTVGTTTFANPFTAHSGTVVGQNIFATGTGSRALDGQIAEVLIYNAMMTEAELNSVVSYLNNKYFVAPPAGVAGDYNGNGTVDAADYVLWRKGDPAADGVDDDVIDSLDYDFWRARFGNTSGGSGAGSGLNSASVPEPTIMVLVAAAAFCAVGRRYRWQHRVVGN